MAQLIIDTGAAANDGTGDPLRTAFTETNTNFTAIYTAGPVDSNVRITNNTILTLNTNGNLVLAPNGVGKVIANVDIVPNSANIKNLGSTTARWSTVYAQYIDITSDLTVGGNLIVTGDSIELGNIITDALTIQLGNTANTAAAANGAGITVGSNDDIATILYNSSGNVWTTNVGISTAGNVTGGYILGDGSQLTNLPVQPGTYGNANVAAYLPTYTGNINGAYILGDGSQLTNLPVQPGTYNDSNVAAYLPTYTGNVAAGNISATGNLTGTYILGNGSQLTNLPVQPGTYNDSNVAAYLPTYTGNVAAGNILISADGAIVSPNSSLTFDGDGQVVVNSGYVTSTGDLDFYTNSATEYSEIWLHDAGDIEIRTNGNTGPTWTFGKTGNLSAPGNISVTGNITGVYMLGNGSQLTNLPIQPGTYNDSNVAAYLPAYTGNISAGNISATGNVTAANFIGDVIGNVSGSAATATSATTATTAGTVTTNAQPNITSVGTLSSVTVTGNVAGGNLIATGNLTGTYILGNGSQLTNLPVQPGTYDNANVAAYLPSYTGNISAGNISVTGNIVGTTNGFDIGYLAIPQVTLSGNVTAALTDSGKHFYSTTAGNLAVTIPSNANVAFPIGSAATIVVQAAGNVIIDTQAGVGLYLAGNSTNASRVVGTYGMATIMKVGVDTWFINGTGVS